MQETSKSFAMRKRRGDFEKWLHGSGIDIGAGNDLLRVPDGYAVPFDRPDGDAQLLERVPDELYDFVYSSHCLEHMRDVDESLLHWTRVCKRGGFLYIIVPDFTYYEKCCWPSQFNPDHKQTFSTHLTRAQIDRKNHHQIQEDISPLLQKHGAECVNFWLELDGFNFSRFREDQTLRNALSQIVIVAHKQ